MRSSLCEPIEELNAGQALYQKAQQAADTAAQALQKAAAACSALGKTPAEHNDQEPRRVALYLQDTPKTCKTTCKNWKNRKMK